MHTRIKLIDTTRCVLFSTRFVPSSRSLESLPLRFSSLFASLPPSLPLSLSPVCNARVSREREVSRKFHFPPCLTSVWCWCVIVDGGLRKIPSEPKSAPVILTTDHADAPEFLASQGHSSHGSPKLRIDIPWIDDNSGA